MKRIISIMLAVLMIFSVLGVTATAASSNTEKVSGNYKYKVLSDETVEIVKYTGNAVTDLTVPSKIKGKTVSQIGKSAFFRCKISGTLTIPGCIKTIGPTAFEKNHIEKVIIKDGVETIERSAFSHNPDLKSVVIPDSVKKIYEYAFYVCKKLDDIKIGKNVESIGTNAFNGTKYDNTDSNWDGNVLYLGKYLLEADNYAKNIKIKKGTKLIADQAFFNQYDLTGITIPGSVKYIGADAFNSCDKLKKLTIESGVKSIGENAFMDCMRLKDVTIGNGVKSVGEKAFFGCSQLKSVTVPDSVETIGDYAFGYHYTVGYINKNYRFSLAKIKNFKISAAAGTQAEKYAKKNSFEFVKIAPSKLTAAPTTSSVKLTWGKTKGAAGYRIYQYNYKTKKFVRLAIITKTTYTVKNLKAETKYKFAVRSYSKSGGKVVLGDLEKINAVTKLMAPIILPATQSTSAVNLSWDKVAGATGYRVYQYNTKTKKYVKLTNTAKTTYTVKNLKSGTEYEFAVKAYTKSGSKTFWSAKTVLTTTTMPSAPKLKSTMVGASSFVLSWDKVGGATGYLIYFSRSKDGPYELTEEVKDTETRINMYYSAAGETFYYKVRAYKNVGTATVYSAYSNAVKVTIQL